ncbi:MAG: hypothetical protein UHY90_07220 [Treponema sp.]|nr:hypothetical protein [Spirochaetia bacterium]MDD7458372.1 hypothetical protein [Spirochaetales bacterium]MDY5812713.1 hypothetical protein [Treponema sp.]MEE1182029.1 hypothetical protein [Treponema sp.]
MAEQNESNLEIFGRKIFFLNPAYPVKKEIIPKLQAQEYEVYTIENYKEAKPLLRKNPDSILFINLDAQLTVPGWFNYVRTFDREDILQTIKVVVMSERIKQSDINIFNKFAHLPYEVIEFNEGIEGVINQVQKIVLDLNAKGKRQYVRANLSHDKDAALFWNYGSKMHHLKLLDISSIGMAVRCPAVLENQIIVKNFLLQDVTMRLGTKQVVVEAVIYGTKQTTEGPLWILLLLPSTAPAIKEEIRAYVSKTIEEKMLASINGERKDDEDYAVLNYYNLATKTKTKTKVNPFATIPGSNF